MSAGIKAALQAYLRSLGPLRELVADRVSFGERRAGTDLPAVTFFRTGGQSVQNSLGPAGMGLARFTVECWGRTGEEAEAVAAALKGTAAAPALDQLLGHQIGDVWVSAARVDDLSDDKAPPAFGESTSDHRAALEVTLWFDE